MIKMYKRSGNTGVSKRLIHLDVCRVPNDTENVEWVLCGAKVLKALKRTTRDPTKVTCPKCKSKMDGMTFITPSGSENENEN